MSSLSTRAWRAAALLSTAALAAPLAAQQVSPPAAVATVPQAPAAAPATPAPATTGVSAPPVARTVQAPAAPADGASATRVNPEAAAQAAAEDAERRTARPAARRAAPAPAPARAVAAAPAAASAPAAPAAAAPPAAPPAAQPAPTADAAPPAPAADAAPEPAAQATQTSETIDSGPALWPLALIALGIVAAGIAFLVMRRRRNDEYVEEYEPAYVEPVVQPAAVAPVAGPVAVAPVERARPASAVAAPAAAAAAAGVMIDDRRDERAGPASDEPVAEARIDDDLDGVASAPDKARIAEPEPADVAAVTAAQTTGDRPWLEFAMRPVRVGTDDANAVVQIELTVGNAGNMDADDVRISTFMLPAGNDGDMERLLIEPRDEAVAPITIPAGAGTRVDATMTLSREELVNGAGNASFQPVIVADARYRLPDGSEGRTSASFLVGGTPASGDTLEPIALDRPALREDVEARLYREPARV